MAKKHALLTNVAGTFRPAHGVDAGASRICHAPSGGVCTDVRDVGQRVSRSHRIRADR